MCDRLRCEKTGQPINPDCHDCLIPADGPAPEMFYVNPGMDELRKNAYAERCANCKWYVKARCSKDDTQTSRNLYCEDWEDINGG